MAGAMPQQRGGSNATTIGMVVSIIVAVLLLGVLIWLITQQEQLKSNAATAQAARDRMARESEEYKKAAALVIAGMTGDQNDMPQTARDKLEAKLADIRSERRVAEPDQITSSYGAVAIIERLHRLYASELDANERLTASFDKANSDLRSALAANAELQQQFGNDLASLRIKVDELQTAKSDFERLKSSETQALAGQIGAKQDALDSMRRDQVTMRQRMREELLNRESLLHEQREALARLRAPGVDAAAQELAVARMGVGTILRALPGDALVHIDLGREDGVRLGMTFAVYAAHERIPEDGRGKAHIEVVSIGRRTSECRVTTLPSPDKPLLEGDRVGNIILSRDRAKKPRFCIVGQFDITFNGQPDARGAEAIAALVRRHGGEVVERVDARTDYVIVGMEPPETDLRWMRDVPPLEVEELPPPPPRRPAPAPREEDEDPLDDEDDPLDDDNDWGDDDNDWGDDDADDWPDDDDNDWPDDDAGDDESFNPGDYVDENGDDYPLDDDNGAETDVPTFEDDDFADDFDANDEDETPVVRPPAGRTALAQVVPAIERSPEVDVTKGPRERRVLTERERYQEAVERAMLLSIPRLTQDRFFNFIGLESGREAMRALEQ